MKARFYLNGSKTTRKAVMETVGKDRLERILFEARENFLMDPNIQNDFYLGSHGMLTIEFC